MKNIFFVLLSTFGFISCNSDYQSYNGFWMDVNYAVAPKENVIQLRSSNKKTAVTNTLSYEEYDRVWYSYCSGSGDQCLVGGPKDHAILESTMLTENTTTNLRTNGNNVSSSTNWLHAYNRGQLVETLSKSNILNGRPDRTTILENLRTGKYKVTAIGDGNVMIYEGDIKKGNFLYGFK
jgi:hypothetical protein